MGVKKTENSHLYDIFASASHIRYIMLLNYVQSYYTVIDWICSITYKCHAYFGIILSKVYDQIIPTNTVELVMGTCCFECIYYHSSCHCVNLCMSILFYLNTVIGEKLFKNPGSCFVFRFGKAGGGIF